MISCLSSSNNCLLSYIVLTISVLIGQEPPAYFENSRDFADKHDYSIICYPIISQVAQALGTVNMTLPNGVIIRVRIGIVIK